MCRRRFGTIGGGRWVSSCAPVASWTLEGDVLVAIWSLEEVEGTTSLVRETTAAGRGAGGEGPGRHGRHRFVRSLRGRNVAVTAR